MSISMDEATVVLLDTIASSWGMSRGEVVKEMLAHERFDVYRHRVPPQPARSPTSGRPAARKPKVVEEHYIDPRQTSIFDKIKGEPKLCRTCTSIIYTSPKLC